MPNEHALRKRMREWLTAEARAGQPYYAVKIVGSRFSQVGVSDWLWCVRGLFLAIETKRPGEDPTPLQRRELEKVTKAGGYAAVCRTMDEVQAVVAWVRDHGSVQPMSRKGPHEAPPATLSEWLH